MPSGNTVPLSNDRRRKLTRFVQEVYTRECGPQPPACHFTPSGYWLGNERIDVDPFIEAAVSHILHFGLCDERGTRLYGNEGEGFSEGNSVSRHVLNNITFAIPLEARVNIFRSFIINDEHDVGADIRSFDEFYSHTRANERHGHVEENGFKFDKVGEANLELPILLELVIPHDAVFTSVWLESNRLRDQILRI
ncbi:hypothetical protein BJY52DRAFT_1415259 [Lactarius psammicola]|nr:hypothetical protein BJY52DRAFT_1415259 [Lactarius psammicola]